MKAKNIHTLILLLLVLIVAWPPPAFAQRRKKNANESSQGLRLREAEFYFTEGEKFFILEDYAKALLYYQRAMEINPGNATVHYKIAEVLSRSNKQEDLLKASVNIEDAIEIDKSNKYFYLLAANIYNSLGKFEKASEAYETMIREVEGTQEYLYELAAVYQYAGEPEEAIKTYDRAEEIFGINEISSIQKARIYLEAGKTEEGLAEGEKLLNAFPGEEHFIMSFTELLSQKGLHKEAISYLEKFTAENREAGNARMLLAGFYRDSGQEEKAQPMLLELFDDPSVELRSKLIILGAYITELHENRTKNISDPAKETFAIKLFEKLLATDSEDANVHVIGGDLFLSTADNRRAQKEYLQAIEMGDASYEVWENLLYLETQLEQWDNAIRHSSQALEIFPNQRMIYYFNGYALMRKRQYKEAIFSFEQAKKLSASDAQLTAEINGLLGDTYNAVKNYPKSDEAYEEALSANPDNAIVLNNYSFHLAIRKENLEKAEKMSSTLIKNNPDNPTFLDTYAWVLYMRGKYRDAKKIIERAISTGKANASHFEHYGDILYKLGDVDGAVRQWEKARGMNANSEILNKKIANRKIYE